jgi:hypothetical protein
MPVAAGLRGGAIDQKFTHSQRRKAWPQNKNRHEPIWSNRHAWGWK